MRNKELPRVRNLGKKWSTSTIQRILSHLEPIIHPPTRRRSSQLPTPTNFTECCKIVSMQERVERSHPFLGGPFYHMRYRRTCPSTCTLSPPSPSKAVRAPQHRPYRHESTAKASAMLDKATPLAGVFPNADFTNQSPLVMLPIPARGNKLQSTPPP